MVAAKKDMLTTRRNSRSKHPYLFKVKTIIRKVFVESPSGVMKSDFQILNVIGRGSYGKVYLVQHICTE